MAGIIIKRGIVACPLRRVSKRMIGVRTGDKPWFDDWYVLAYRAKQRIYRMWTRSRMQADLEEYRVACRHAQIVYVDVNEHSPNRANHAFTERSTSRRFLV